ncbi:MAG: hypothetical protein NTZ79_12110 [Proteobacteria bacterium]|nr:hypothetical protein [Pseudomonadota bacterium]
MITMMKHLVCTAALLLPLMASAVNAPAPQTRDTAQAQADHGLPHSMQQTSRASAMKAMADCQHRASSLGGVDKQHAVQACMRGG